jgi:phage terminase small subunit
MLLNPRHEAFAQAICRGSGVLVAHKDAGYSPDPGNAHRLVHNPKVAARIAEILGKQESRELAVNQRAVERLAISKESVAKEFALVGKANLMDFTELDQDGHRILNLDNVTRDQMAAVASMSVDYYVEGKGKEALKVKRVKVTMHPKVAALEKLARMFGWIVDGRYLQQDDELAKLTARLANMTPEQRRADAEDVIRRAKERLAEAARDEAPLIDNDTGEPMREGGK